MLKQQSSDISFQWFKRFVLFHVSLLLKLTFFYYMKKCWSSLGSFSLRYFWQISKPLLWKFSNLYALFGSRLKTERALRLNLIGKWVWVLGLLATYSIVKFCSINFCIILSAVIKTGLTIRTQMKWSRAFDFQNKLIVLPVIQLGGNFFPMHLHSLAHVWCCLPAAEVMKLC